MTQELLTAWPRTAGKAAPSGWTPAARAVLRLGRPWFWPLGWGGAYLGSVLATRSWLPPIGSGPASVAMALVLGPLIWTAVLAVNDVHDLPGDRVNPRKATAPLVTGELTVTAVTRWGYAAGAAAVALAAVAGWTFAAGTVLVLLLGHLYSAGPVRLKGRPGADVAVNAVVIGVLAPLAGWSLHRDPAGYPPVMAVLGVLLVAALYLPTTVLDRDADLVAGDVTAAVRWSPPTCYRAGLALWTGATALWLAALHLAALHLAALHLGVLVERDTWWFQIAAAPVLVAAYAVLARRPSIPRLAVVTLLFAVPAADFLTAVTGSAAR